MNPVYFRNQPLGCTATIIYQMFEENHVEIPKQIAGLLCSAIISDTLMFRSPTCTQMDEHTCRKLAKIANIDIEAYAIAMFNAGSKLMNETDEEIFYQDYKVFSSENLKFGIGQDHCVQLYDVRCGQATDSQIHGKHLQPERSRYVILHADEYLQRKHRAFILWQKLRRTAGESVQAR